MRRALPAWIAALVVTAPAAGAQGAAYCNPAGTQFDPADVPPGGAALIARKGVTRRFLTVDGIRTPVLSAGPAGSREAVVFVHGSPGSSQSWLDLLPRVAAMGRRTIAFDLPGYGHATKPWQPVTDFRFGGAFLEHLLRRLQVDRVQLVIHDLGGVTGLQWAAAHPRRLIGAVVIASGLLGYRHHSLAQVSRRPVVGESFWAAVDRQAWRYGMQIGQDERPLPFAFLDQIYDDLDRATRCTILHVYRSAEASEVEAVGAAQARVLRRRRRPAHRLGGERPLPAAGDGAAAARAVPGGVGPRSRGQRALAGRRRSRAHARARAAVRALPPDPRGWARMALPSLDAGRHVARASKAGLRAGSASVVAGP